MSHRVNLSLLLLISIAFFAMASSLAAGADLPLRVILATEKNAPLTAQQQWHQTFERAGVGDLQIRQGQPNDKPDIENVGTEKAPLLQVTGIVTTGNELLLPGARFTTRDREGLNAWLTKLRTGGVDRLQGEGNPFGLSVNQIKEVNVDLARPNQTPMKGLDLRAALRAISKQLKTPVMIVPGVLQSVTAAEPVRDDLTGISCGTAIAALLRPEGLIMRPEMNSQRKLQYSVAAPVEGGEAWPVGWKPKQQGRELLPEFFDARKIELDEVSVKETLDAITERVKAPVLYDHPALARWGLDPATATISMPERQASYATVLNKALFQSQLKYELRVDEANKPFLWITSIKPTR